MQSELKLSVVAGGSYETPLLPRASCRREAGGNKATWIPRPGSSKVIDLYFREKRFEVTQEGRGPQGRPRFLVNRTRKPDGKLLQGRDITELIQKLDFFWSDLIEVPVRLDRIEGKIDRIAKAVAVETAPSGLQGQTLGGFSRMPLPVIRASEEMTAATEEEKARLLTELEAEKEKNARLSDELAALKRHTSRGIQRTEGFKSKILIVRPELIESVKSLSADVKPAEARNIAMVIHQFSYLLEKGFGKDLGDGRYIYGSYPELQSEYFPIWSERTLQRTLLAGEHFGLVKSKQPERNCSRRKYYALTSEGANLASSGKKASSMPQNGTLQDDAKMASSSYIKNKNSSKHEHDHDYGSSSSHQHDHVHGPYGCSVVELQPPEQDLLNQIEELTERENRTEHYRTTWSMRIRDHPNDVFKAIGQTRLDAREGKIKKSIGGMLNWHFEKFRKASAKAPRK
jgi:hypothetical protein